MFSVSFRDSHQARPVLPARAAYPEANVTRGGYGPILHRRWKQGLLGRPGEDPAGPAGPGTEVWIYFARHFKGRTVSHALHEEGCSTDLLWPRSRLGGQHAGEEDSETHWWKAAEILQLIGVRRSEINVYVQHLMQKAELWVGKCVKCLTCLHFLLKMWKNSFFESKCCH